MVRRQVANGIDPKGQKRKHDVEFTVRSVSEEYLKRHGHLRSLRGRQYDLGLINVTLGSRPIASVKVSDLVCLGDKIEVEHGAAAADRVRATWQTLANWHSQRVDDFRPPTARRGAKRNKAEPRSRVLSDDEIRKVWHAADTLPGPFGRYVRFLLLTATRRNEAAGIRRSELVNEATWVIPGSRCKGKRDVLIPLSAAARQILRIMPIVGEGDLVFTNDGRRAIGNFVDPKLVLDKAAGVSGWRLHDLRRTARTLLSRARVDVDTAERCLGHAIGGVRATYDRHEYESEKRRAFEALARQIELILHPSENKVVRLRGPRS
jgi:integrase